MELRLPAKAGSFFSGVARRKGSEKRKYDEKRTQMCFAVCWIVMGCVEIDGSAVFPEGSERILCYAGGCRISGVFVVFSEILSYFRGFCRQNSKFTLICGQNLLITVLQAQKLFSLFNHPIIPCDFYLVICFL